MSESFVETVELIRAARDGNRLALDSVAQRFRTPLLERIRLMMGAEARSAADSDDFLQGLFCEIMRDFDRLRSCDERSFLRWASHLARNNIRDVVRRRRESAVGMFASSIDWRPARPCDAPRSPPDAAEEREQVENLIDAMMRLPEDYRRVVELRDFDELSFARIGEQMQRSENAVQLLHHRALIQLGMMFRTGGQSS